MTKTELENELKKSGVNPKYYSLYEGLPNETYCLNNVEGEWEVCYSERGNKNGLKKFESESLAFEYFYNLLVPRYSNSIR